MDPNQIYQQAASAAQQAMNGFGTQQPYNAEQFYQQAAAEAQANAQGQYGPYAQQNPYYQQNPYQGPQQSQPSSGETQKAKSFLGNFLDYLKNGGFKRDIDCTSRQYNVPPKQLAENFLEKCLGTIGDILGVVISTAGNAMHTLVDVLASLAHGAANIIVNVANGIASLFTLNKTCAA